jgi:RNA polymerase sigma-70 factor (ECF subfamily)
MDLSLPIHINEFDLIAACTRNDRRAQQTLYETYYSPLMAICLRYASSHDEALDMLHEGFIKIFKNIGRYQAGTSLGGWLNRLMVNNCIDQYRRMHRRRTEDIDQVYDAHTDEADAVSQFSEQEILAAIQQLPPTYRAVFNLYVIEGYSHKEIGEALEITESTSRSNLVKARGKLREMLVSFSHSKHH